MLVLYLSQSQQAELVSDEVPGGPCLYVLPPTGGEDQWYEQLHDLDQSRYCILYCSLISLDIVSQRWCETLGLVLTGSQDVTRGLWWAGAGSHRGQGSKHCTLGNQAHILVGACCYFSTQFICFFAFEVWLEYHFMIITRGLGIIAPLY